MYILVDVNYVGKYVGYDWKTVAKMVIFNSDTCICIMTVSFVYSGNISLARDRSFFPWPWFWLSFGSY